MNSSRQNTNSSRGAHCRLFTALAVILLTIGYAGISQAATYQLSVTVSAPAGGNVVGPGTINCPGVFCGPTGFGEAGILSTTATSNAGWQFVRWTGSTAGIADVTVANPTFTMGAGDRVLNAVFCQEGVFNFSAGPNGSITGSATQANCTGNTSGPTATPDTGYYFEKWTTTCATPSYGPAASFGNPYDPAPFTGGQVCNVVASFVPNTVNLTTATAQINEGFNIQFGIKLDKALGSNAIINWSVAGSGANPAAAGDFSATSGNTTILAGATTATINVATAPDVVVEPDETFTITLDSVTGGVAFIGATKTAIGTIKNNDTATVSIAATTQAAEDATGGLFTLTTTNQFQDAVTVNFAVGGTAASGTDYTSIGTSVVFPANQSTVTIPVTVAADAIVEANETVIVTLTGTSNVAVTVDTNPATVTIADDDVTKVSITATDATATESGTTTGTFTVSLDGGKLAPPGGIAVSFATTGTATSGTDYTALSTPVTIAAGANAAT
ncbi:MAG: Calx-beta domain-containing protein, partial [Pseudomonadota bacterium]